MADLFHDAFYEDRPLKNYGRDIFESHTVFSFEEISKDILEAKSNNVSFMKVEELDVNCRNLVLTSDSFVCYSVTQKKNLLRAIDTLTGEKTILRGHEGPILDMKLSANPLVFATVDHHNAMTPHFYVWQKNADQFGFSAVYQSGLKGYIVKAHPVDERIWVVADKNHVGVVNTKTDANVSSYEKLGMHHAFDVGTITDVSFSEDGSLLFVSVMVTVAQSYIQVFSLLPSITSPSPLKPLFPSFASLLKLDNILCVQGLGEQLVVLSKADNYLFNLEAAHPMLKAQNRSGASAPDMLYYDLRVYGCKGVDRGEGLSLVQSVIFSLPKYSPRSPLPSSSLYNPSLEASLTLNAQANLLLLTSRCSAYGVAFGLLPPSASATTSPALAVFHLTPVFLKAPPVSSSVRQGLKGLGLGEDPEAELGCFQEEAGDQASVTLYSTPLHTLFVLQAYTEAAKKGVQRANSNGKDEEAVGGQTILSLLKSLAESHPPATAGSTPSSSSSALKELLDNAAPLTAPLQPVSPQPIGSKAAHRLLSPSSDAADAPGAYSVMTVGGDALHTLASPATVAAATAATTAAAAAASATPGAGALAGAKKLAPSALFQFPAASSTPTPASAPASSPATIAPASATNASAASAEGSSDLPDFVKRTSSRNTPILQSLKKTSSSASVTSASASASAVDAPTAPSPAPAVATPKAPAKPLAAAATTPVPAPIASPAAAITPTPTPAPTPKTAKPVVSAPATAAAEAPELGELVRLVQALRSEVAELKQQQQQRPASTATAAAAPAASLDLAPLRKEIKALGSGVVDAVKSLLEEHKREVKDSIEKDKKEMSESITAALVTALAPRLKDVVRDHLRTQLPAALAAQLPQLVKEGFQTSLLPAFQAGTNKLLDQLGGALEAGLNGVGAEVARSLAGDGEHGGVGGVMGGLERELGEVKEGLRRLEELIQAGGVGSGLSASATHPAPTTPPPNPEALVKAGKIQEGVKLALDMKDTTVMLATLSHLNAQMVVRTCSPLTRLCVTQQLAADLSDRIPPEGLATRLDWLKHLVLSLLNPTIPAEEAEKYERYFKVVVQGVLESLSTAQEMLRASMYDEGEEGGEAMPPSVHTDLMLLEQVLITKI